MDAFYGELRLLPYTFIPLDWLPCDGRELQIMQYQALFAVIGFQFGGDQQTKFKLPNLGGRVAPGAGANPTDPFDPAFAQTGGVSSVPLGAANVPPHTHTLNAIQVGQAQRSATPAGNLLTGVAYRPASGTAPTANPYAPPTANGVQLHPATVSPFAGGTAPHENRQPALALRWFICAQNGAWPSRP